MGDKFVATVRFHTEGVEAELYQRLLEGKKEAGISLPDYIKQILAEYFEGENKRREQAGLVEQFQGECREMMAGIEKKIDIRFSEYHMAVMEALAGLQVSGIGMHCEREDGTKLPEQSEGIPEGALDFLDGMK